MPTPSQPSKLFFFFNDTATTEIYTLSLHDALPILPPGRNLRGGHRRSRCFHQRGQARSEEHTSELQSHLNLVCRLLLEKKKYKNVHDPISPPRMHGYPSTSTPPTATHT